MFLGPHKMKMSTYFSVFDTLWNFFFFFWRPPPPNFELFPTETWDFFDFLTTPPLFGLNPKFRCFFNWNASLSLSVQKYFLYFLAYSIHIISSAFLGSLEQSRAKLYNLEWYYYPKRTQYYNYLCILISTIKG